MSDIESTIQTMAASFSGVCGVCAQAVGSDDVIAVRADEEFAPASVIKLPILVACLQQVQVQRLALDEPVVLRDADKVIGSGILKTLHDGLTLTLEDALVLMIIVSDNTATNLVLDRVPPETVNRCMGELGLAHTYLSGKLFSGRTGRPSSTTPRDMANLLIAMATKRILTPALCDKALDILGKQQLTDIITRELPYDPFSVEEGKPSIRIASKSGALRGIIHDVGVVTTPDMTYAVALMSKGSADERFHPDHEAKHFLARVSRTIYDYYTATDNA